MSDAAPMSREEWAAEFLDAKGDLIPAPDPAELRAAFERPDAEPLFARFVDSA